MFSPRESGVTGLTAHISQRKDPTTCRHCFIPRNTPLMEMSEMIDHQPRLETLLIIQTGKAMEKYWVLPIGWISIRLFEHQKMNG